MSQIHEKAEFILENRYFVVKLSDVDRLNNEETYRAISAMQTLDTIMPPREGIFIEKDWGIYPQVLELLKQSA